MQPSSSSGISPQTQLFVVLAGLAIMTFVLYLVRHKRLREQYALLWILASLVLVLSAVFSDLVEKLSHVLGIDYPPAFLFLIAILMILVLQIHFSTVISNLREQNTALIQDLGIVTTQLRELRNQIESGVSLPTKESSKIHDPISWSSPQRTEDHPERSVFSEAE
jgi:hypothetical protein